MAVAPCVPVNVTGRLGGLRERLRADHQRIELLVQRLLEVCAANDGPAALIELWTEFRSTLEAHLDQEEAYLFPSFMNTSGRELRVLTAEHRHLRSRAQEVEVAVRQRAVAAVRSFAFEVRAQVASESRLLGHRLPAEEEEGGPSSAPTSSSTPSGSLKYP